MQICLLGDIAVIGAADPSAVEAPATVTIAAPRLRLVLAMLALSPGAVNVDVLADVVWGEGPPPNWKAALRNAVAKLRRHVEPIGGGGEAFVATTPAGYRLGSGQTVDVHLSVSAVEAADDALQAGEPDQALELAAPAAAALGDILAPGLDVAWLIPHRTRAHAAGVRALEIAAAAARSLGRASEAVAFAERAVERDPLREETHRQLIAAHRSAGNRGDALRAYEHCRRTLADELGVAPDERTVAHYLDALGSEPSVPPSAPVNNGRVPFVGRGAELDLLTSILHPGAIIVITGPGGIGKSRLAAEIASLERERFDGGRFVIDLESVDDDGMSPAVCSAIGIELPAGADDVEAMTASLAPRGPTLIVLDGADRCLDSAATTIGRLATQCPNVAFVATARGPLGTPGERVLRLGGLDPTTDGLECFIEHARASGATLPVDDAEAMLVELCRAVGGSPMAIELTARQANIVSLADLLDRIVDADEGIDGARYSASPADPLETSLAIVVASSLDLLDDTERVVFARLAVIAGSADLQLVQSVACDGEVPARRAVRILSQLADRGLVQLDRGAVRWRYQLHPELRATARALLGDDGLHDSYRRLGAALFARLPSAATAPPSVAATRDLLSTIRGFFAAALGGEADLDEALRLAFWLHRYWAADGVDEGTRWLQRLLLAAGQQGTHRGPASFALGYLLLWAGRLDEAAEHLGTATVLLVGSAEPIHPMAHFFLASTYENRRPDLARFHFTQAIDVATAAGNVNLAAACAEGLATIEFESGEFDAGLARVETALTARQAFGGDEAVKSALPQYAMMLIAADRFDDADRALRRAEQLLGDEVRIAAIVATTARARLERHRGRPEIARRHAQRALDMIEVTGARRVEPLPRTTLALLDLAASDAESAIDGLVAAAKTATETDQVSMLADVLDAATIVAMALGRVDRAGVISGAVEALRSRAQVVRGLPEQRELNAAVDRGRSRNWSQLQEEGAAVEHTALADLVAS